MVVAQRDPAAIAGALRTVLTRPGVKASMTAAAEAAAPGLRWSVIADRYRRLAARLVADAAVAA
jgi:hypothetical protein